MHGATVHVYEGDVWRVRAGSARCDINRMFFMFFRTVQAHNLNNLCGHAINSLQYLSILDTYTSIIPSLIAVQVGETIVFAASLDSNSFTFI